MWNVENFFKIQAFLPLKRIFCEKISEVFHIINIWNVENFFPFLGISRKNVLFENFVVPENVKNEE